MGIAEYQMTAALWQRAHLQYDYGVHPQEIRWYTGGLKTSGYLERNAIPSPPGVSIELIPEDQTLEQMVTGGELEGTHLADPSAGARRWQRPPAPPVS